MPLPPAPKPKRDPSVALRRLLHSLPRRQAIALLQAELKRLDLPSLVEPTPPPKELPVQRQVSSPPSPPDSPLLQKLLRSLESRRPLEPLPGRWARDPDHPID